MFCNYHNLFGMGLFNKAVAKYGEEFKPIFAIMPEEKIRKYIEMGTMKGLSKLRSDFKINKQVAR